MKRQLSICAIAAAILAAATPAPAAFPEEARQALRLCVTDLQAALAKSSLPKDATIAILPVKGDQDDTAIGVLKNAATGAGLPCVEGKEDPFVQEVFKEAAWDERKDDILDPGTLAKFGKLKAAKLLMYGVVREATGGAGRGYAELEVHVSSIETKQHLWGQVFTRRFYNAQDVTGLVDLDPDVRALIQRSFEDKASSLREDPKLKSVKTVAIIPLGGDLAGYVTKLAESMVSKTQLIPKTLDTATLGEARALLRDNPAAADAVLYGAVRDLSRKLLNRYPDRLEYETTSAVQITIQESKTGNVLWSDIIEARGKDTRTLSWWEMVRRYGPLVLARKWYVLVPVIAFAALLVLFVVFRLLRRAR
jgi:hypothetical protein